MTSDLSNALGHSIHYEVLLAIVHYLLYIYPMQVVHPDHTPTLRSTHYHILPNASCPRPDHTPYLTLHPLPYTTSNASCHRPDHTPYFTHYPLTYITSNASCPRPDHTPYFTLYPLPYITSNASCPRPDHTPTLRSTITIYDIQCKLSPP